MIIKALFSVFVYLPILGTRWCSVILSATVRESIRSRVDRKRTLEQTLFIEKSKMKRTLWMLIDKYIFKNSFVNINLNFIVLHMAYAGSSNNDMAKEDSTALCDTVLVMLLCNMGQLLLLLPACIEKYHRWEVLETKKVMNEGSFKKLASLRLEVFKK